MMAIKGYVTKNKNKKIVIIVPTDHLKKQWILELNERHLLEYTSVEIINSAIKINSKVDFLIIDECHRIPSDSFYAVFNKRNPTIVLGLSATFSRLDGRHELLNRYCPVCDTITITEALENGWLSPYKEYKVLIEPSDLDTYKALNAEFIDTFSIFEFNFNTAMSCLTNIIFRRQYGKQLGIPAKEMDAIVFTWNRALKGRKSYVMNHEDKLRITRKILESRPQCKAITFSATKAQAEKIGVGYVVHSGKTKKKNSLTIEEFNKRETGVINTAKSLDEGADVPGLNLAIILCNSSSPTQKTQRVGRVIRYQEGKNAEVFTLVIKGTMEEGWYQTSSSGKKYMEINEAELDEVLARRTVDSVEKEAKSVDTLFRL